eukprot:scaffold37682_cov57-Cyclotella_meneghiniana.AAC.2
MIDEIDPDRKIPTIKIDLANGVESRVNPWEGIGTSKQFLCHMMFVREGIKGMGLFSRHEEAKLKVSELKKQLKKVSKGLKRRDCQRTRGICLREADKACYCDAFNDSVETIKQLKTELAAAKEGCTAAMAIIFSTTSNFFRGDSKTPWDKIVSEQTKRDPWMNLHGVEQYGVCGKTLEA